MKFPPVLKNRATLLIVAILLFLNGCQKSDHHEDIYVSDNNLDIDLAVPVFVSQSIGGYVLQAEVTLTLNSNTGNKQTIALAVNNDDSISGTVSNIKPGIYTLYLEFFTNYGGTRLSLASYTNNAVTVASGIVTPITIADYDRDFDYDFDGAVNLAELRAHTNPMNAADFPKMTDAFTSLADASFGASSTPSGLKFRQRIGEPLAGSVESASYKMRAGYTH